MATATTGVFRQAAYTSPTKQQGGHYLEAIRSRPAVQSMKASRMAKGSVATLLSSAGAATASDPVRNQKAMSSSAFVSDRIRLVTTATGQKANGSWTGEAHW